MPGPVSYNGFFRLFFAALIFAIITADAGLLWSLFELSAR